jgi:YggT family protein
MGALVSIVDAVGYALVILIFIRVAFSWISQDFSNPIYRFSYRYTEPIIGPVRRRLPTMGVIDISPAVVTFGLLLLMGLLRRLA